MGTSYHVRSVACAPCGDSPPFSSPCDETFSAAADRIGLEQIVVFTDFAPLEELLRSLPSDPDLEEGLVVLEELGYLVIGAGEDDGTALGRFVLTLRRAGSASQGC